MTTPSTSKCCDLCRQDGLSGGLHHCLNFLCECHMNELRPTTHNQEEGVIVRDLTIDILPQYKVERLGTLQEAVEEIKEESEKEIREIMGDKAHIDYERNHSHYHCWDQDHPPACGIKLEDHKQCCLCDTPTPQEESLGKEAELHGRFIRTFAEYNAGERVAEEGFIDWALKFISKVRQSAIQEERERLAEGVCGLGFRIIDGEQLVEMDEVLHLIRTNTK